MVEKEAKISDCDTNEPACTDSTDLTCEVRRGIAVQTCQQEVEGQYNVYQSTGVSVENEIASLIDPSSSGKEANNKIWAFILQTLYMMVIGVSGAIIVAECQGNFLSYSGVIYGLAATYFLIDMLVNWGKYDKKSRAQLQVTLGDQLEKQIGDLKGAKIQAESAKGDAEDRAKLYNNLGWAFTTAMGVAIAESTAVAASLGISEGLSLCVPAAQNNPNKNSDPINQLELQLLAINSVLNEPNANFEMYLEKLMFYSGKSYSSVRNNEKQEGYKLAKMLFNKLFTPVYANDEATGNLLGAGTIATGVFTAGYSNAIAAILGKFLKPVFEKVGISFLGDGKAIITPQARAVLFATTAGISFLIENEHNKIVKEYKKRINDYDTLTSDLDKIKQGAPSTQTEDDGTDPRINPNEGIDLPDTTIVSAVPGSVYTNLNVTQDCYTGTGNNIKIDPKCTNPYKNTYTTHDETKDILGKDVAGVGTTWAEMLNSDTTNLAGNRPTTPEVDVEAAKQSAAKLKKLSDKMKEDIIKDKPNSDAAKSFANEKAQGVKLSEDFRKAALSSIGKLSPKDRAQLASVLKNASGITDSKIEDKLDKISKDAKEKLGYTSGGLKQGAGNGKISFGKNKKYDFNSIKSASKSTTPINDKFKDENDYVVNDINDDKLKPIWEIVSGRYWRSVIPIVLEKEE